MNKMTIGTIYDIQDALKSINIFEEITITITKSLEVIVENVSDYDDGYNNGFDEGKKEGYWDGYEDGYQESTSDHENEMDDLKCEIKRKENKIQKMEKDVEYILRKIRNISGFKKEYERNLDFSIIFDRLHKDE